ncbi:MAG: hypothetical protein ACFHHU_00450 [Porticoccaceae bacterium]
MNRDQHSKTNLRLMDTIACLLRMLMLPVAAAIEIFLLLTGLFLVRLAMTRPLANWILDLGKSMPEFYWYLGKTRDGQ